MIAILATLVITAYNGVQTKAKNAKTVSAVEAWVKAIDLYYADNGSWPPSSCLGDENTYPMTNGSPLCYDTSSWIVKSAFLTAMRPYIGSGTLPSPDTTNVNNSTSPRLGALFYVNVDLGPVIYYSQIGTGACPKIGGLTYYSKASYSNGETCEAQLAP